MKKKKLIRIVAILVVAGGLIGGASAIYMFNMPHRDVLASDADYSLTNSEIVAEYLANKLAANDKYLAKDGNSKILEVTGTISKISENYNDEKVVLLKENGDKAGVSATFTSETNHKISDLVIGETVTVKGVIRSGASYDEDLELYENVILEKSDIVSQ
jgi:ABC-type taurine transport system substrate-binding protein